MPRDSNEHEAPPSPAAGSKLGSLVGAVTAMPRLLLANKFRLAIAIGGVLGVGIVVGLVTFFLRRQPEPVEPPATLEMALKALDDGDLTEAKRLAEKLHEQGGLAAEEWGGPVFVLGAVAFRGAEKAIEKDRRSRYQQAAQHLEEAANRGLPVGREAEGRYLLAKSLYLGGRLAASRPALDGALKTNPQRRTELRRMLVDVNLNMPRPDLGRATEENQKYLAIKTLSTAERQQGLLQRAEILFRLGKLAESAATLEKIPSDSEFSGAAMLLRGRIRLREAQTLKGSAPSGEAIRAETEKRLKAARELFQQAQGHDNVNNHVARPAMYLIGLCYLEAGDNPAALQQFTTTSTIHARTAEGQAAAFQEAQVARRLGKDAEALGAYRRALTTLGDLNDYYNPWLPLTDFQAGTIAACKDFQAAHKYQAAVQWSLLAAPLIGNRRSLEIAAESHRQWARHLAPAGESRDSLKPTGPEREARLHLRQAGAEWAKLALLEAADRRYPDLLWQSALAYFEGRDYRAAIGLLREYTTVELRQHHAQALVLMGEARMALGQWDKALDAFEQCITDHPRDVAAYRARYLAATTCREQGNLKQAETLLALNLSGDQLTPASKEWRDSLFLLGELLHGQGRYVDAIRRLEEAIARYPTASQTESARYLDADAALRYGRMLITEAAKAVTADTRQRLVAEGQERMNHALAAFQNVEQSLAQGDASELSKARRAMLRNCRFAIGEIQVILEQYQAALRQYTAIVNVYADSPEALEGYVQLARVYRRLNRMAEARTSLQQAKIALTHIKSDVALAELTNYDRKQWSEVFQRMSTL